MLRIICLAVLLLLTSCGVLAQTPPDQAVKLAIAQTLTNQQQAIAQTLNLSASKPNFKIEKIDIKNRQKITSPDFKQYPGEVYRIRGTFDTTLRGPAKSPQLEPNNPFDLYLSTDPQDTSEIETWFLIYPSPKQAT